MLSSGHLVHREPRVSEWNHFVVPILWSYSNALPLLNLSLPAAIAHHHRSNADMLTVATGHIPTSLAVSSTSCAPFVHPCALRGALFFGPRNFTPYERHSHSHSGPWQQRPGRRRFVPARESDVWCAGLHLETRVPHFTATDGTHCTLCTLCTVSTHCTRCTHSTHCTLCTLCTHYLSALCSLTCMPRMACSASPAHLLHRSAGG